MSILGSIRNWFYEPASAAHDDGAAPSEAIAKRFGGDVPQMPATKPTEPVGTAGVGIYAGYVQSNERSADLRGAERHRKFEEWKRIVAPVGGALRSYLYLIGAPDWSVEAWKERGAEEPTPEDEERAAFIETQLHAMYTDWKRVVMELSLALFDGSSMAAWTAKVMPPGSIGTFGLDDVMHLPASTITRWDVDKRTGRLRGVVQEDVDGGAEIPIARERLVWQRDLPTTASPTGDGVMRFLAESIRRLLELQKLRDKGFEKDVNGVPVVYAPIIELMSKIDTVVGGKTYTRADFNRDMEHPVAFISADVRKNAGLIVDSSTFKDVQGNPSAVRRFAVDVLTAQSTSHAEINNSLRDLVWDLLVVIGFEHLALGRDGAGSLAMHASKIAGTLRIVTSVLNGIAETARRDIVRPIYILNGWDPKNPTDPQNLPTLTWDALEFQDLDKIVAALAAIIGTVEPGRADDAIDQVLANAGLPPLKALDDEGLMLARDAAAERAGLGKPKPADPDDPDPLADDIEED